MQNEWSSLGDTDHSKNMLSLQIESSGINWGQKCSACMWLVSFPTLTLLEMAFLEEQYHPLVVHMSQSSFSKHKTFLVDYYNDTFFICWFSCDVVFMIMCMHLHRLFSHLDDPFLDDPLPREYVLYLRPSGPLQNQLSHFWQQSRLTCGKNKAHNIFPHITLCQFFMVSHSFYLNLDLLVLCFVILHFLILCVFSVQTIN